jgi:hypothetical protein
VKPGQEYDSASGKFKRVAMSVRLIRIYLPKLSNSFGDLLVLVKEIESGFILYVFLKREFRPWKQTNRNPWLSNRSEPTGDRVPKLGRY